MPWAPSHVHKCEAHSDGVARWLPVWVPPPSHPMHKALWGGAGLDAASGSSTGHMGMVSSDLRCSVVSVSRLMTVDEARSQGITLEEIESTVGRRVMARSTSVQLEVRSEPWGHAAESEQRNTVANDASSDGGSATAEVRDTGLCDNLMKLRSRVLEGKLTRGQLRAHVMQFSGRTRIAMEAVPELARVLAEGAVPTTPVHAGEFELLLGCLRSYFDTYHGPPATSPPVRGAAPAPAPSLTPGARGLRVVIVPDTEESASGAPSSDVSDVTAPSTSWVAVSPSHLDLDTPSRGMMIPSPAADTAAGSSRPGAPSPQDRIAAAAEQRAQSAQRLAEAAERQAQHAGSAARDSRVTADAVERKEAKLKPNAVRSAYETRRCVACNDVGYLGHDERVDAPVEDELDAVLGTDAQAAAARNRFKIDIPPERRTAGGRIVDRGGLWFAYMQGPGWYTTVQTAVTTPADAFFQYGIAFQVTHKAIERASDEYRSALRTALLLIGRHTRN